MQEVYVYKHTKMEHIFLASKGGNGNRKFDSGKATHMGKIVISMFKLLTSNDFALQLSCLNDQYHLFFFFVLRIVVAVQLNQLIENSRRRQGIALLVCLIFKASTTQMRRLATAEAFERCAKFICAHFYIKKTMSLKCLGNHATDVQMHITVFSRFRIK